MKTEIFSQPADFAHGRYAGKKVSELRAEDLTHASHVKLREADKVILADEDGNIAVIKDRHPAVKG